MIRAPSQYPKICLFVRSRKVSKPRDWYFKLPYRFEIGRHNGSTAAVVPVKFQRDWTILNTNLVASTLYEILRKHVFSDIEMGPWLLMSRDHLQPWYWSFRINSTVVCYQYAMPFYPLWPSSLYQPCFYRIYVPDSKVHGANVGPIWGRWTQVGPMLAP